MTFGKLAGSILHEEETGAKQSIFPVVNYA
jgi:hypothetical protein